MCIVNHINSVDLTDVTCLVLLNNTALSINLPNVSVRYSFQKHFIGICAELSYKPIKLFKKEEKKESNEKKSLM